MLKDKEQCWSELEKTQRGLRGSIQSALGSAKPCPPHICTMTSESSGLQHTDRSFYVTNVQEGLVTRDGKGAACPQSYYAVGVYNSTLARQHLKCLHCWLKIKQLQLLIHTSIQTLFSMLFLCKFFLSSIHSHSHSYSIGCIGEQFGVSIFSKDIWHADSSRWGLLI